MSYQQTYNASIPYSGSVSVSYPKSESGGRTTAYYSGEVPVHVTINVNTAPFDGSVSGCNSSIDILTGSVAAMHAAQCAAISETAKDVSKSLIDGFFGTINTELSQQIQALDSAVKAGLGLLLEQGKAVSAQKQTLETDYNRISSRYAALFSGLDNECYKRIYALDKQAFMLAEKVKQPLLHQQSQTAALNILEIEETSNTKSFLLVSNLNTKALQVLRTLYEYITQESRLTNLVSSFLNDEQLTETRGFYMPLIFSESDALESAGVVQECFIQKQNDDSTRKIISETAEKFCASCEWEKIQPETYGRVKKEFDALAESYFAGYDDETSRRIYETILSLRDGSEIFDIKRRDK